MLLWSSTGKKHEKHINANELKVFAYVSFSIEKH